MTLINIAFFAFLLLFGCNVNSQLPVVDLFPQDLLSMQRGIGMPRALHIVEGHEALLRVEGTLVNMQSCVVTTPAGTSFEVQSPPNNRYEAWSDGCGVRIRQMTKSDEGRWRLNGTGAYGTLAGWSAVIVINDTKSYSGPEIELLDGKPHADVELTTLDNSYCVVTQPFSESSLIPGHCRVTLDRATRAVQGNWNVLLGLPGKVQELQVQRRIDVEAERLDVGYVRDSDTSKLHLYCNIQNTEKNVTFCRFQKTSSSVGYNVLDGLSDGVHSYYGDGTFRRDCGLTIENPTVQDYGTWRCSVGVQQWVGNHVEQQTPLQALISVGPESGRMRALTDGMEDDEIQTVFVQQDQSFTVMCRADESLSYCWFQHPNGSFYTPVPIQTEDQPFWYTGENLQVGDCGITFTHATEEDSGLWTCHMGPSQTLGLEITNKVEVRVTGPLAANKKNIATYIGDTINLYCHTSNGNKPLEYCRFLSPTALGFRIDSTITEENALGRYFFMAGKGLDYGDCALTIKGIEKADIGTWTCAALINDNTLEAWDTIEVYIGGARSPLSKAGIAGMAVGSLVLTLLLIGVALYKTGYLKVPYLRHRPTETVRFSFGTVSFNNRSSNDASDDVSSDVSDASSNTSSDINENANSSDTIRGATLELGVAASGAKIE